MHPQHGHFELELPKLIFLMGKCRIDLEFFSFLGKLGDWISYGITLGIFLISMFLVEIFYKNYVFCHYRYFGKNNFKKFANEISSWFYRVEEIFLQISCYNNDFGICRYKIVIYFRKKISWVAAFCENFLSEKREKSRTSLELAGISFIACIPRNVSFNFILDKYGLLCLKKSYDKNVCPGTFWSPCI
jgi:hypothetical protein